MIDEDRTLSVLGVDVSTLTATEDIGNLVSWSN